VLLNPGLNTIEAVATCTDRRVASDQVTVTGDFQTSGVRVQLSWDTNGTDVDLWVTEPSGEKVYFAHKDSEFGGHLDVDDVDGYGPENYTIVDPPDGDYVVQVHYWSDHGYGPSNPILEIFLDEIPAARFGPQRLSDDEVWDVAVIEMPSGRIRSGGQVALLPPALRPPERKPPLSPLRR
jgi:hypothetical protein